MQSGPHHTTNLAGDSRYAFWAKYRELDAAKYTYDLWGFDALTESAFVVASGPADASASPSRPATTVADTRNGIVAWFATESEGSNTLRVARLADVLPTAPRESGRNGQTFFPEVAHTLGGSFQAFWERNGGLPVFGFPHSESSLRRAATQDRAIPYSILSGSAMSSTLKT